MNYAITPELMSRKCRERAAERKAFRALGDEFTGKAEKKAANDRSTILALVDQFESEPVHDRIAKALARLPASASWELKRQVIKEEWEA